jgi:hypothetical protein
MASTLPSAKQLWDELAYNPLTGELFWRIRKQGRQLNRPAGTWDNGYRKLVINRQPCLLHRVVWVWLTGEDPGELMVDHIDRDRGNNRWWNLRLGSAELNSVNTPGKGYYLATTERRSKPWRVTRYTATGRMCCERYATEAEAKARSEELFINRCGTLNPRLPIGEAVQEG